MTFLTVVLTIAIGFLVVFSLYVFYMSVRPDRIYSRVTPEAFNVPYEKVHFSTSDGITLSGWFVPKEGEPTDKVVILAHGYPADKGDIFPAFYFLRKDFNLFFFDFRYHGESGGRYTTIGGKEVEDMLHAIDYLKRNDMKHIGIVGFSMGGAVALMSLDKTNDVEVVVSDSAYARLDLMAGELYRQMGFMKKPLLFMTHIWSRLFLRIDLKSVSPMDAVRGKTTPILLIHSKADEMIPFAQAQMLQEALSENPNAEFYFRNQLTHGMIEPEYQKRIAAFLKKHLS